ncbi:MAG: DUF2382 domain-containing protein [Mycobacteriales bacterium]
MATHHDPQDLIGRTAVDASGNKIGKVGQVYIDDKTGDPVWVTLSTGLFGGRENFAPLEGSSLSGSELRLTVSKDRVKEAPTVDNEGKLEKEQQDLLYRHYAGHVAAPGQTEAADGSTPDDAADKDPGAGPPAGGVPRSEAPAGAEGTTHQDGPGDPDATQQFMSGAQPGGEPDASADGWASHPGDAPADQPVPAATDEQATDGTPPAGGSTGAVPGADQAGDELSAEDLAEPDVDDVSAGEHGDGPAHSGAAADGLTGAVAGAGGDTHGDGQHADDSIAAGGTGPSVDTPATAPGGLAEQPDGPTVGSPTHQTYGAGAAPHIIPVNREDVHIERIPIAEGEEIGEINQGGPNQPHEIILYAERVTVTKRLVPVERVRIHTTIVAEDHDISPDLAKQAEPDPRSGHGLHESPPA